MTAEYKTRVTVKIDSVIASVETLRSTVLGNDLTQDQVDQLEPQTILFENAADALVAEADQLTFDINGANMNQMTITMTAGSETEAVTLTPEILQRALHATSDGDAIGKVKEAMVVSILRAAIAEALSNAEIDTYMSENVGTAS